MVAQFRKISPVMSREYVLVEGNTLASVVFRHLKDRENNAYKNNGVG